MRGLIAAVLGFGLGFAGTVLAADEAQEAAPVTTLPAVEKPRGVCHFTSSGVSLTVEDTTAEACHEREVQCQQDKPGHEAECKARWTAAEVKAKPAKKARKTERAEKSREVK